MPNLFMIIGQGTGSWTSKYDEKTGKHIEVAPSLYQICVGTDDGGDYHSPYGSYYQRGWYQGCWFINNPMPDMLRTDFIKLMTKVNNTIGGKYPRDRDHCPIFKGNSFIEIYPRLVKCMNEIIEMLKNETGNDSWTYKDSDWKIKDQLQKGDELVASWTG